MSKRLEEFMKNHEMFVQELLEYAKNDPKSFRESIAEIVRVISDYKALMNRVQESEKERSEWKGKYSVLKNKYRALQRKMKNRWRYNRALENESRTNEIVLEEFREENKRYQDMLVKIFKIVQNHQIMKISDEDYANAAIFLYKWIYDTGAIDHQKHFSELHGHDEFDSYQISLLLKRHLEETKWFLK